MMIADKLYVARWTFPDGHESLYHTRMTSSQAGEIESVLLHVLDRGTISNYEVAAVEPYSFRDLAKAIGEETNERK